MFRAFPSHKNMIFLTINVTFTRLEKTCRAVERPLTRTGAGQMSSLVIYREWTETDCEGVSGCEWWCCYYILYIIIIIISVIILSALSHCNNATKLLCFFRPVTSSKFPLYYAYCQFCQKKSSASCPQVQFICFALLTF
jgi:hypothetical protein